jgi:hypothetical protein
MGAPEVVGRLFRPPASHCVHRCVLCQHPSVARLMAAIAVEKPPASVAVVQTELVLNGLRPAASSS